MHYHIRPLLRNKATPKWYRAVHFKNLTRWAERRRGFPRRGELRFRVQGGGRFNEKRLRLDRRRLEEAPNRMRKRCDLYGLAAGG
jgi:hypothetical protein